MHLFAGIAFLILTFGPNESIQVHTTTDTRDGQTYSYTTIGATNWMTENLRFETPLAVAIFDRDSTLAHCGFFYPVSEALTVCPAGWRLPTEKEVTTLIKQNKKGHIDLIDTLQLELCGRIDSDKHAKAGAQNTFWIDADMEEGHITHWHTFGNTHKIHSHDVVNADRKFPVRCVCDANKPAK